MSFISHDFPKGPTGQRPFIWSIGGGKGGVGKTLIGSALGISLARMGYRVTIIDLDLGSANLHSCLGASVPQLSLSDFLSGRERDFSRLCAPTEISKLTFISGLNDSLAIANLGSEKINLLIRAMAQLPADIVILDLGAGTQINTLEFFLEGDRQIITVTPEPTSIENAYRFIKAAFYYKIKKLESALNLKAVVEEAMDQKNQLGIRCPADLIHYIIRERPEVSHHVQSELAGLKLDLIMNQTRSINDVELGGSILSVCRKYFGVSVRLLGHLDYDNAVWQAVRKRRPVLLEFPHSVISGQFLRISKNLLDHKPLRAVV